MNENLFPPNRWSLVAQAAYEAYDQSRGGKNHLGLPNPTWAALPEGIQAAWAVAVEAAVATNKKLTYSSDTMAEATAKRNLRDAMPIFKLAISAAEVQNPGGKVSLSLISKKPDGSGGVVSAEFGSEEFMGDVAAALGVKDNIGWMAKIDAP